MIGNQRTLSPLEQTMLQLRASKRYDKVTFKQSVKRDASQHYIREMQFRAKDKRGCVINIYGKTGTGRSTLAIRIAQDLQHMNKSDIKFVWSYKYAQEHIKKKQILIVEQGEKLRDAQSGESNEIASSIKIRASQDGSIVLLVTDKQVSADLALECIEVFQETNIIRCLLKVYEHYIGLLQIKRRENVELDKLSKKAKEEFLKGEINRIYENIAETTKEFLEEVLVPEDIIFSKKESELRKGENAILPLKIICLGGQQSGKTTFVEMFYNILCNYYEEKNVHAVIHKDKLTGLLMHGFQKKFVNLLVSNDFTYNQASLFDLRQFMRLRHYMFERTGLQQALAAVILNLHQLAGKGSERGYRIFIDLFILLQYPTDSWTRDYFQKYIPAIYLEFLKLIDEKKKEAKKRGDKETWNRLKGYGIAVGKGYVLPFYLNTKDYPVKEIPELQLPDAPEEKVSSWEPWEEEIITAASATLSSDHSPFGYKDIIPRLDPEITEGFLLEVFPKIRNIEPRRRLQLARETFALAKYHAWKELDQQEEVLESSWVTDWEEYVDIILEKLYGEQKSPTSAVLDAMIDEIDQEKYDTIRRSSYSGKNFRTMIKNKIKKFFHTREIIGVRKKELKDRADFDPNRWRYLRNILKQFFIDLGVTESYARICTSMILWKEDRGVPKEAALEDMPLTMIVEEWSDEIKDRGPIDMAKTRYHKESYSFYRCWDDLSTKEIGELIGEQYAFGILEKSCSNLTLLSPLRAVRDLWFLAHADLRNNPFDLALFAENSVPAATSAAAVIPPEEQQALAIFNVKTLTKKNSDRRFGFGMDHPGTKVFWTIKTRPFKETIKARGGVLGSNSSWEKIALEQLLDLFTNKSPGEKKA